MTLLKGPPNSQKTIFFKHNIFFSIFYCHIAPTCQKLCFYNENGDFWPFRALFALFKRAPKLTKNDFFFKHNIFPTFLCHIEPAYQKLCFYDENGDFWPFRAPFALFKRAPKLIKNGFFSKIFFSFFFLCHIEHTCQKLCFYHQNCGFWPFRVP